MRKFELGTEVIDRVSGIKGIAVSCTEYLNGCFQYGVQPKLKKGMTEITTWNIDEAQLEGVKKKKLCIKKKEIGGLTRKFTGSTTYKI